MKQNASASSAVRSSAAIRKPKALRAGARLGVFAPASPADEVKTKAGLAELARTRPAAHPREGPWAFEWPRSTSPQNSPRRFASFAVALKWNNLGHHPDAVQLLDNFFLLPVPHLR